MNDNRPKPVMQTCALHRSRRETRQPPVVAVVDPAWHPGGVCGQPAARLTALCCRPRKERQHRPVPVPATGAGLLGHGDAQTAAHVAAVSEYGSRAGTQARGATDPPEPRVPAVSRRRGQGFSLRPGQDPGRSAAPGPQHPAPLHRRAGHTAPSRPRASRQHRRTEEGAALPTARPRAAGDRWSHRKQPHATTLRNMAHITLEVVHRSTTSGYCRQCLIKGKPSRPVVQVTR